MPRNTSSSQNTFLDTIATRFDGIHSNFVLGNAQAHGWPIVYCSDGFCELTGYTRANVMAKGSGCKFLYGPETSEEETAKILEALEEKTELKTELELYRKNGSPFWCLLDIVPIKNEKRDVVLFLVSHKDITKEKSYVHAKDGDDKDGLDSNSKKSGSDDSSDEDNENHKDDEDMPANYDYGRRRSRAVLYHISGQLNKQSKAKTKLQQLNRLASQMPEYKVQEVRKSRFIIVHYGIFKIGWDWLILLCTFYIAFMVPFNAAFRKAGRLKDFMYVDAAVEVLFAIDIMLNFRTTFLNKSGQIVYESRLIAINYIKGWFVLDLLAAVPFDLLYAFSVETVTMVHLLKVARLLRLARLLQKLERYNQYSFFVLALLLCMFALLAHWLACIWYAIGKAELDDMETWTVGWLYELSERLDNVIINKTENIPDMMTSYMTALYFTCSSLTSVGFGNVSANTNGEKIFSVCAMLLGAIMHAVVFGNVTTIIQRMYARKAIFHSKTKDLKDFFRIHHFPKELKHRMRDYFQAMWSINNGIDFKEILKDFPEDMRGEIGLHLHREILSLPIFQMAPPGCLKTVSLKTERFVCGPGEFIMRKGDAVNYLYYVCSGSLEVLKDDQVVAILGKGDIFGTDLDYDDPVSVSGCDVRSLAYCELLCIQVKGLVDALLLYPDFADTFNTELPNDLTYNVREGHDDHSDDESSSAAPVITLPSISEDEEENEDKINEGDLTLKNKSKQDDFDDDIVDGKGSTPMSPLLSRENVHANSSDWLTSRGRLPNGHIGNTLRDEGNTLNLVPPTVSSMPTTPTQPLVHNQSRSKLTQSALTSLAMRRAVPAGPRLMQRRCREKLKTCRTLPTLTSVSSERSVEQVMVHTLQMELEGTRDTVIGLERRLDDLHDDLSSISRNVDSLLRLVSQSPSPSNMYLSSHSLQPSPNPNMYQTPSFYFSQSTDYDTRDSISLQSASSPAPDTWSGYGFHHRNDQFLSPFQTSRTGYATPSPLASPRVNFSQSPMSGYFPSFVRQGSLNIKGDRAPTSDHASDRAGSINTLHPSAVNNLNKRTPAHTAQVTIPQSHLPPCSNPGSTIRTLDNTNSLGNIARTSEGTNSGYGARTFDSSSPANMVRTSEETNSGYIGRTFDTSSLGNMVRTPDGKVSSPLLKNSTSRPSNLSSLEPRKSKSLFVKPSKVLPETGQAREGSIPVVSTTAASPTLRSPTTSSDQPEPQLSESSTLDTKNDSYQLAKLEPCSVESGHCKKGEDLRQSNIELLTISYPKIDCSDLSITLDGSFKKTDRHTFKNSDLNTSIDTNSNHPLLSKSKSFPSPSDFESRTSNLPPAISPEMGTDRKHSHHKHGHLSKPSSPKSPLISPSVKSLSTKSPSSISPSLNSPTLKSPSSKSTSPKSPLPKQDSPSLICPPYSKSKRPKRPQSLSPSLNKVPIKSQMPSTCSPEDIVFIDSEPTEEKTIPCPTRNYSPPLSQPPSTATSLSGGNKRTRSVSTSAINQGTDTPTDTSTKTLPSNSDEKTERHLAPLSKVESL